MTHSTSVTLPTNRTLCTVNCRSGRLIGDIQGLCELRGEKMTFSTCRNCQSWDPYDPRFSPLSFVTITAYGIDEKDRQKREERHSFGDAIEGDMARQPDGRRIPQFVTFSDGLLKSLSQVQNKGDVFDDIEIHPKREREP